MSQRRTALSRFRRRDVHAASRSLLRGAGIAVVRRPADTTPGQNADVLSSLTTDGQEETTVAMAALETGRRRDGAGYWCVSPARRRPLACRVRATQRGGWSSAASTRRPTSGACSPALIRQTRSGPTRSSSSTPGPPTRRSSIASAVPVQDRAHRAPRHSRSGDALNLGWRRRRDLAVLRQRPRLPDLRHWLERAHRSLHRRPDVALCLRPPADATGRAVLRTAAAWRSGSQPHRSQRQSHPFCNNANAAIRRSFWEDSPYDEHADGARGSRLGQARDRRGHGRCLRRRRARRPRPRRDFGQVVNRYRREAIAHKRIYNEQELSPSTPRCGSASRTSLGDVRAARTERPSAATWPSILTLPSRAVLRHLRGFAQTGPVHRAAQASLLLPAQEGGARPAGPQAVRPCRSTTTNADRRPVDGEWHRHIDAAARATAPGLARQPRASRGRLD